MRRDWFGWMMSAMACAGMLLIGGAAQAAFSSTAKWIQIDDSGADFLFVRPDADLSRFDKVMIDPLSVWYADSGSERDDELQSNIQRLCAAFEQVFSHRLERAGFQIVTEPAEGVLRLHVEIIDMKLNISKGDAEAYSSKYLFAVVPGQMTLVGSLHDSQTDEILLRMADVEKGSNAQPVSVWDEVDVAFGHWSTVLSASITGVLADLDRRMVQTGP